MKDFQYINQCKVIFGKDAVNDIAGAVAAYGKNILFVYGKNSIRATGLYDRIFTLLRQAGINIVEHGGVRSNPILSHAMKGIELAKQYQVNCILAVGGGSVIDEAKVIALGSVTDKDVWTFFKSKTKPAEALPIITVQTIAATGSEMNGGAVLTNELTREKLGIGAWCIIPKISILDPKLTFSVPKEVVICGFVDAFSHVMEGYFNGESLFALVQDEMAEGIFRSIIKSSINVLEHPDNYQYRSEAMWAACLAHNGLLNSGRGKVVYEIHCLAHILGALFDIPHGAAISVVIPAWMQFRLNSLSHKFSHFGRTVFSLNNDNEKQTAIESFQYVREWIKQMGAPSSFADLGISRKDISSVFQRLALSCSSGEMRNVTEEQAHHIVRLLFNVSDDDNS